MRYLRVTLSTIMMAGAFLSCAMTHPAHAPLKANYNPRPSGNNEAAAAPEVQKVTFIAITRLANIDYDIVAQFPRDACPSFDVKRVTVNGADQAAYLVENHGVLNMGRRIHGSEDFTVAALANWEPDKSYEVVVEGTSDAGKPVRLAAAQKAPTQRGATATATFASPTPEFPYHNIAVVIAKESIQPGKVVLVEVDGKKNRDARFFNTGIKHPGKAKLQSVEGESYEGVVDGARDFKVVAPVNWLNGSKHSIRVKIADESKQEKAFEAEATAPAAGGYWNADWPKANSVVLTETAGVLRQGEPVHLNLGFFADDIKSPEKEIRVVTYDPTSPKADKDGYVVAPSQVTASTVWRDQKMLNSDEKDPETHERVHRYDATTSVELVFLADSQPYQEKVYQVLYGNPKAEPVATQTDLKITPGEGLSQTVENQNYKIFTSKNSGSVEQVTILGSGEPVLLEHKLETNGAVHWNPDFYSPPTPWVHASDWENPVSDQITGPIMHRTRRYAPMPHLDTVPASVSYEFYAGKPYVVMSSYMEVQKDMFVQAMRNGELVFNHAVLNEFVWLDPLGKVQRMLIEGSRKHPIHALEIPADTPWMAFINREKGVGFASINLAFQTGNRYGQPASETQPYIYVQNGPWIYWARPIVYPFGGMNFTRMMPVRAGSFYSEKCAWVPFRFDKGNDPFKSVETLQKELTHPLLRHEWMATDDRTPEKWVMPILTMPFNEGVAGAVSGHKETKK